MSVQLNHTIVWSSDRKRSARFLAAMLGQPAPETFGHFEVVLFDNGVALDFADHSPLIQQQHYAFLINEELFDAVLDRIQESGLSHWADPLRQNAGINHADGGRGLYFLDPDDHLLEIITRPYGNKAVNIR